MPTQADAECVPELPDGSEGVGTTNVAVTLLYVPCAHSQSSQPAQALDAGRTAAEFQTAPAQLDEYSTWLAFAAAWRGSDRRGPPARRATRSAWRSLPEGSASALAVRRVWTKRAVTNIFVVGVEV